MKIILKPFDPFPEVTASVDVSKECDKLSIQFLVEGFSGNFDTKKTAGLDVFQDNLWKDTCFELFISSTETSNYLEWNLASNGTYAVYAFRKPRELCDENTQRTIRSELAPEKFQWEYINDKILCCISLNITKICAFIGEPGWKVQPTLILKKYSGSLSYWAEEHTKNKPDFHQFSHLPEYAFSDFE
jgi:hypothetical protein